MTAVSSNVLVIDDNELTRSLLMLILRGGKYNVVGGAENVARGVAMAKSLRPDVVLLDNHMPDGDGVDCIKAIRKELPKAIILMVTANSEKEVVDKAMMMGANGFVIKPFNTQSVLGTIDRASKQFILVDPATPSY